MIKISTHLIFSRDCLSAMQFYQKSLGGNLTIQNIATSPMAVLLPSEKLINVLDSRLTNSSLELTGADSLGDSNDGYNEIAIHLHCDNEDEMREYFSKLSADGTVLVPLHQTFWGFTTGSLMDKFGIKWLFKGVKN